MLGSIEENTQRFGSNKIGCTGIKNGKENKVNISDGESLDISQFNNYGNICIQ